MVTIKPKVATHSANHCGAGSHFQRRLDHRQRERQMRDDRSKDSGDNLRRSVKRCLAHCEVAFEGEYERHGGIEIRAGNRAEDRDQDDQDRPCWQRVGKQHKRRVLCQGFAHDARPDDGRNKKRRSEGLGSQPLRKRGLHVVGFCATSVARSILPISRSFALRVMLSRLEIGRLRKIEMRFLRYSNVVTKAASF